MTALRRLATLGLFLAVSASGATAAPARTQIARAQIVSYLSGAETVSGYLVSPARAGRRPAIIVVHGDRGLDEWTKQQAQRFGARGYVVIAVDLYRGEIARNTEDAHELMRGLPDDRALRDLQAAFTYLAARRDVRTTKIAVIGWDMGGWYALQLAIHQPNLAACVVDDSALPTDRAAIAQIRAPVLGNFGADDRGIPASALQTFEAAMQSAGHAADLKSYPGAADGFDDSSNADRYRAGAAADAWNRTVAFFVKTLGD